MGNLCTAPEDLAREPLSERKYKGLLSYLSDEEDTDGQNHVRLSYSSF